MGEANSGTDSPLVALSRQLAEAVEHVLTTVDGLLTGLHEPEASHLDLLTAFLPAEKIKGAYEDAVRRGYLWHEFGDLNLIL